MDALRPVEVGPADLHREQVARYDEELMHLGGVATITWVAAGLFTVGWCFELLVAIGLPAAIALPLAPLLSLSGARVVVLRGYRWARARLRQRRLQAWMAALPISRPIDHLSPSLRRLVRDLRRVRSAIQLPNERPERTILRLRGWLHDVAALEGADADRLRDRGLDPSQLRPLTLLSRLPSEPHEVWNDRSYRRLQAAVPVLTHIEDQLCRVRDFAYR